MALYLSTQINKTRIPQGRFRAPPGSRRKWGGGSYFVSLQDERLSSSKGIMFSKSAPAEWRRGEGLHEKTELQNTVCLCCPLYTPRFFPLLLSRSHLSLNSSPSRFSPFLLLSGLCSPSLSFFLLTCPSSILLPPPIPRCGGGSGREGGRLLLEAALNNTWPLEPGSRRRLTWMEERLLSWI